MSVVAIASAPLTCPSSACGASHATHKPESVARRYKKQGYYCSDSTCVLL